jgi:hypothetical protein
MVFHVISINLYNYQKILGSGSSYDFDVYEKHKSLRFKIYFLNVRFCCSSV